MPTVQCPSSSSTQGESGGDGQIDTFQVNVEADQIVVSLDGETVASGSANQIESIRIVGSEDRDRIEVNFADLALRDFEIDISVEGRGGDDTVLLTGACDFQSLIHSISHPTDGSIVARTNAKSASVDYRGIESIEQQLETAQTLIDLAANDADAVVDFGAEQQETSVSIAHGDTLATVITLQNPSDFASLPHNLKRSF